MRWVCALAVSSTVGALVAASTPGFQAPVEERQGRTPNEKAAMDPALREAVLRRDVRAVESRLASGADPRARETGHRTLLMEAVAAGDAEVVQVLLRGGAEAGDATATGWTALHEATIRRQAQVVRDLLDAGAPPDPRDRVEATPLDIAEREGMIDLARLLRERGARGSGKSLGDTVCVRPWSGDGYCGIVESREGPTYRIRVSEVVGCGTGCSDIVECTGGKGLDARATGSLVEVPASCLTHTGLGRDGGRP